MRETRLSGSEGRETELNRSSLPLSSAGIGRLRHRLTSSFRHPPRLHRVPIAWNHSTTGNSPRKLDSRIMFGRINRMLYGIKVVGSYIE